MGVVGVAAMGANGTNKATSAVVVVAKGQGALLSFLVRRKPKTQEDGPNDDDDDDELNIYPPTQCQ